MSAALRSFSAPAFRRLLVCLWQVNSSIAGLTSIASFANALLSGSPMSGASGMRGRVALLKST